jgi:SAM-dependent methyltransferase
MTMMSPEMQTLKTKLKAVWMSGDFGKIAEALTQEAEAFIARLAMEPNTQVLDVACGTGNLAIPAARAGARVTGMDLAPNLLEQARARAKAEQLTINFDEGDAEQLPYDDARFDTVVTMFGAMFAPQPEQTAAELLRVCKPGGRIAMANWTPTGFIGRMFKVTSAHVPPPNIPSPLQWGSEAVVHERLHDGLAGVQFTRRMLRFEFPFSAADVVEFFRLYYGPTHRAFAALDADGQAALRRDLEQLWSEHNLSANGSTRVDAEYLEVMAIRQ